MRERERKREREEMFQDFEESERDFGESRRGLAFFCSPVRNSPF